MQRVSIMSMSNEELVESIHKDFMADECRQRLCEKNTAFLYREIRRYCGNLSKEETEDLLQEGYVSLIKAAADYRPGKGANFLTYAEFKIHGGITDYMCEMGNVVRIPSQIQTDLRAYRRAYKQVMRDDYEYISHELGWSIGKTRSIHKLLLSLSSISLDAPINKDQDKPSSVLDMLDSGEDISDLAEQNGYQADLKRTLDLALKELPDRSASMIRARYYQGLRPTKICKMYSLSRQGMNDVIEDGFRRIRKGKYRKALIDFISPGYRLYKDAEDREVDRFAEAVEQFKEGTNEENEDGGKGEDFSGMLL